MFHYCFIRLFETKTLVLLKKSSPPMLDFIGSPILRSISSSSSRSSLTSLIWWSCLMSSKTGASSLSSLRLLLIYYVYYYRLVSPIDFWITGCYKILTQTKLTKDRSLFFTQSTTSESLSSEKETLFSRRWRVLLTSSIQQTILSRVALTSGLSPL